MNLKKQILFSVATFIFGYFCAQAADYTRVLRPASPYTPPTPVTTPPYQMARPSLPGNDPITKPLRSEISPFYSTRQVIVQPAVPLAKAPKVMVGLSAILGAWVFQNCQVGKGVCPYTGATDAQKYLWKEVMDKIKKGFLKPGYAESDQELVSPEEIDSRFAEWQANANLSPKQNAHLNIAMRGKTISSSVFRSTDPILSDENGDLYFLEYGVDGLRVGIRFLKGEVVSAAVGKGKVLRNSPFVVRHLGDKLSDALLISILYTDPNDGESKTLEIIHRKTRNLFYRPENKELSQVQQLVSAEVESSPREYKSKEPLSMLSHFYTSEDWKTAVLMKSDFGVKNKVDTIFIVTEDGTYEVKLTREPFQFKTKTGGFTKYWGLWNGKIVTVKFVAEPLNTENKEFVEMELDTKTLKLQNALPHEAEKSILERIQFSQVQFEKYLNPSETPPR